MGAYATWGLIQMRKQAKINQAVFCPDFLTGWVEGRTCMSRAWTSWNGQTYTDNASYAYILWQPLGPTIRRWTTKSLNTCYINVTVALQHNGLI